MSLHSTFNVHQHTGVTNKLSRKKMEIYVMKKKFLTLALVLMVAVTLFAAKPVEVSGTFDFGYKITFNPLGSALADNSKYSTFVSVSSDYWKVNLTAGGGVFANNVKNAMTADIYLSKALAAEGVDMGDLDVTLHAGTGVGKSAPSVFADKAEFGAYKAAAGNANAGATVKYGALVEVYGAADLTAKNDFVFGAKTTPVEGVSAALGYATAGKVFAASAAADIKKLANLDFDLAASVAYQGDFTAKTNKMYTSVYGSYSDIGLWVQYGTDTKWHRLAAKASYSTTIEGFGLAAGVKVASADLTADPLKVDVTLDGSAAYTLGGVKYKLALEYVVNGAFTLTPSASFSF
jgi:hypothetical protein